MRSRAERVRGEPLGTKTVSLGAMAALLLALTASAAPAPEKQAAGRFSAELPRCLARGGHPAHGPFGEHYCKIRYPDAGRACTDGAQCVGDCLYGNDMYQKHPAHVVGRCQTFNVKYGCYFIVREGRAVDPTCGD